MTLSLGEIAGPSFVKWRKVKKLPTDKVHRMLARTFPQPIWWKFLLYINFPKIKIVLAQYAQLHATFMQTMTNFMMNTQLKIMITYIVSELIFLNPFQKGNDGSAGF